MNPMSMLFGNGGGNMNPNDIFKALGMSNISVEKIQAQVFDKGFDKIISVLYNEFPEESKKDLFYDDPRRSEKEKSVVLLVNKAFPEFVKKLNNNDLDTLFNKIQKHKGE